MHGGLRAGSFVLGDLWLLDGSGGPIAASLLAADPASSNSTLGPRARAGHALAYDAGGNRALLFGGFSIINPLPIGAASSTLYFSSTWAYSFTSGLWTMLGGNEAGVSRSGPSSGNLNWPPPRARMGYGATPNAMYIVGGVVAFESGFGARTLLGDVWEYNFTLDAWRSVRGAPTWGSTPAPRYLPAVSATVVGNRSVLGVVGGWTDGVDVSDGVALSSEAWMLILDADATGARNASWIALPSASAGSAAGVMAALDGGTVILTSTLRHASADSIAMRSVFSLSAAPAVWNASSDAALALAALPPVGGVAPPQFVGWRSLTPAATAGAGGTALPVYACVPLSKSASFGCATGVYPSGWAATVANALTGLDPSTFATPSRSDAGTAYIVGATPSTELPVALTRPAVGIPLSLGIIIAISMATALLVLTLLTLGDASVIACMRLRSRLCAHVCPCLRNRLRASRYTAFLAPQHDDDMESIAALIRQLEAATARQVRADGPTPEHVVTALPQVKFSVAVSALAPVAGKPATDDASSGDVFVARARKAAADGVAGVDTTGADCSVCLLEYSDGDALRIMPCGHFFHAPCIERWLRTSSKLCPMCKRSVVVETTSAAQPVSGAHV